MHNVNHSFKCEMSIYENKITDEYEIQQTNKENYLLLFEKIAQILINNEPLLQ